MLLALIRHRFIDNGIYLGDDRNGNIKFYAYGNNLYVDGYTCTDKYKIIKFSKKQLQKALMKKGAFFMQEHFCKNKETLTAILHHFSLSARIYPTIEQK